MMLWGRNTEYVPTGKVEWGSIVWCSLRPTRGRGQHGYRASIVISDGYIDESLNQMAVTVPVTTQSMGHTFEIPVPQESRPPIRAYCPRTSTLMSWKASSLSIMCGRLFSTLETRSSSVSCRSIRLCSATLLITYSVCLFCQRTTKTTIRICGGGSFLFNGTFALEHCRLIQNLTLRSDESLRVRRLFRHAAYRTHTQPAGYTLPY